MICNAKRGDLEAFNQLVLNYQDMACRHASALTGDPSDAEDVTQESFIKAFQNLAAFRGGSFLANTSHDLSRRRRKYATAPLLPADAEGEEMDSPAWLRDPAPSVQAAAQYHEEARQLYRILNELPAAYRSIITLVDLYGLDYSEAAQVLHIPIGTVKSRLTRACMKMKNEVQANPSFSLPGPDSCLPYAHDPRGDIPHAAGFEAAVGPTHCQPKRDAQIGKYIPGGFGNIPPPHMTCTESTHPGEFRARS